MTMLQGYALLWDDQAFVDGQLERVEPYAFDWQLSNGFGRFIRLHRDHFEPVTVASVHDGSMRLSEDNFGLRIEADLVGATGTLVAGEIARGEHVGCSICFKGSWQAHVEDGCRVITRASLAEISLTDSPAYRMARTWLVDTSVYDLDPAAREQHRWFHMNNDTWRHRYVKPERPAPAARAPKPAARPAAQANSTAALLARWPLAHGAVICDRRWSRKALGRVKRDRRHRWRGTHPGW